MTSNFSILKDYDVAENQEEIKRRIEKIEDLIFKKHLDHIYGEGGLILEEILSDDYDDSWKLHDAIGDLTSKRIVPTKVKDALYSVKSRRNEAGHRTKKGNLHYFLKPDLFSVVEFLKQLFLIIKFFVGERNKDIWTEDDHNEYSFDPYVYLPNAYKNDSQEIEKVADVAYDRDFLDSRLKSIFELISSDFNFLIPTYQRAYIWSKDNVDIFLQDIKDRTKDKKPHYMGSLAVAIDHEEKILRLIDGQQRITTCLLLLRAIINRFNKTNNYEMPRELEFIASKLSNKYSNSSTYGSISHIKKIMINNLPTLDMDFVKSRVYENFIHIDKYLNDLNYEEFNEFYTSFFSYFTISEIRFTYGLDQEIQIFENVNSKGTELSQWDLIKNYIYKKVSTDFLLKNEVHIERMIKELFLYPAFQYFGEKKKSDKLSKFFSFYCRIKSKLNKGEVLIDKGKIHKVFASLWPPKSIIFDNIVDLRASLLDAARLFKIYCILVSKDYLKNISKLFKLKLHLENASIKDVYFPLIINAIKECVEWNKIEMKEISNENKLRLVSLIGDIYKYITRLMVVNNIAQDLLHLFDSCISRDIEESHEKFIGGILKMGNQNTLPPHEEFEKMLRTKNDWQAPYAMIVLRSILCNDYDSSDEKDDIYAKHSLEHIFPQAPKDDSPWFQESGLTKSKFLEKISSKANKLGNYLLVPSNKISKLKNKSFAEKLEIYESFADKNLLIGNSGDHQIMNLLSKKTFTMEDIDNRTKEIRLILSPLYKLSFEK